MRKRLRAEGFRIEQARSHETNVLFDHPKDPLGKQGKLIRIRRVGRDAILTYKGPSKSSRFKKREELEVHVSDAGTLDTIFQQLGYQPVFRYEKYRTEFVRDSETGKVLLDETPMGNFLELEGPPRWIDSTARLLGFGKSDYIRQSYGYLHMLYCREHGIQRNHMLFRATQRKA